jgi:hypothetical protein
MPYYSYSYPPIIPSLELEYRVRLYIRYFYGVLVGCSQVRGGRVTRAASLIGSGSERDILGLGIAVMRGGELWVMDLGRDGEVSGRVGRGIRIDLVIRMDLVVQVAGLVT